MESSAAVIVLEQPMMARPRLAIWHIPAAWAQFLPTRQHPLLELLTYTRGSKDGRSPIGLHSATSAWP